MLLLVRKLLLVWYAKEEKNMKDSVCKVSEENHQLEMPSCPLKYFFGICVFISMSVRQLVELCDNGSVV